MVFLPCVFLFLMKINSGYLVDFLQSFPVLLCDVKMLCSAFAWFMA